jgi:hypothetical protein
MVSTNKYNAQRVAYTDSNGMIMMFDSQFELRVYKELLRHFNARRIARQYKVMVKPKTHHYPAIHMKIDFAILIPPKRSDSLPRVGALIEAKGFITDDFKTRLKFLEYTNSSMYDRLVIVKEGLDHQSVDCSRLTTTNIPNLHHAIDLILPLTN